MDTSWRGALAISWNDSKKEKKGKLIALFVASAVSLGVMSPAIRTDVAETAQRMVQVIVRETPGGGNAAEQAVRQSGGEVGMPLRILNGFVATVPQTALAVLTGNPAVLAVSVDGQVQMHQTLEPTPTTTTVAPYDPVADPGSMYNTNRAIRANDYWKAGYTGRGIDVAVIDTGVVPVQGLDSPNKVVNGPDFSFESQVPELQYLDTYGHGTHVAGIIAGRDASILPGTESTNTTGFMGVAPDARIVNLKVGDYQGAVDVSQVIAAIDWVVRNRNAHGLNIRVLNMSFGTDGVQDYVLDPLTYATEVAWRKGIVVVAAAGNQGFGSRKLSNPAYDPFVIAVGADVPGRPQNVNDDSIADFSSTGNAARRPDFVVPGKSVQSLRNPGSFIDDNYPTGVINDRFFRGSGTSQSAAVVSGAVALLLQQRPDLTPDQVKMLLTSFAVPVPGGDVFAQGAGLMSMKNVLTAPSPTPQAAAQTHVPATGLGSLDAARGTLRLVDSDANGDGIEDDPIELTGEIDIHGTPWDPAAFGTGMLMGTGYSSDYTMYVGEGFLGKGWAGKGWAGKGWAGKGWASTNYLGKGWAGKGWAGKGWAGKGWAGKGWGGKGWGGKGWAGVIWG